METPDNQSIEEDSNSTLQEYREVTRQASESAATIEKHEGKQMSVLHEYSFIITICMAQILALSGLGQGLGDFFSSSDCSQLMMIQHHYT